MKNNIVLIGFMGVGKGTVARALVRELDIFSIDCDDLIESFANRKISKIFADDGETKFREIEKKLANFLQNSVSGAIISTGGGFYKVPNLKDIGVIIYLKSDFDSIIKRIKKSPNAKKKLAKRPLLKNLKKAKMLHNQRDAEYEKIADFTVDVRKKSLQEIVEEIQNLIKE